MKAISLPLLLLGSLSIAAHGSSYVTNFNDVSYGAPGGDLHGNNGWTISDTTDQFSQVANWNGSKSLNLGDASAVASLPTLAKVSLGHAYAGTVGDTTLSFKFALIDSLSDTPSFRNRDRFGVNLVNASSNVFGIYFKPTFQSTDPSGAFDPLDLTSPFDPNPDAEWDLFFSVDGGASTVPLNLKVYESATYTFNLDFGVNLVNPLLTDFDLTITSGVNVLTGSVDAFALNPGSATTDIRVDWAKHSGNPYGSNSILIDDLSVVPEPSSSLLLCLAGLGLVVRRKRA